MRNAVRTYKLLLSLYPYDYRAAFAAPMLQAFIDHYTDVERCEGQVSMRFWLSTIADELVNIRRQRMMSWTEEGFLRATTWKLLLAAAFLVPLYPVFLAGVVKTSLTLPHPSLSGIGVIVAFGALLVIPSILGLTVSYLLACLVSALVGTFSGRRAAHTR
jgi:hypothetical protein